MADVAALERVGDEAERLALAAEHVDRVGARAGRDLRHHGLGDGLGLAFAQHLVDDQPRRAEAVAPDQRRRVVAAPRRRRGGRSMRGSVDTSLAATAPTSVVCRRKPGNSSPAAPNTPLIASITGGALRRV
jgi:hypothetical protein